MEEVEKRKPELLEDAQAFLRIKSVLDVETAGSDAPFGKGVNEALTYMLNKGKQDGFIVKNVDGYGGHIELGQGEEIVGILCHVDVVPEGDGWDSDPYGAEIRDGKMYARGAIDDKGPTMAAYYALKIVKELALPLSKRVRIILGTDEESEWRCVDHYFKQEEMPSIGFAPDADFPIIHAEKGIADLELFQESQLDTTNGEVTLERFESGRRLNMVPDFAEARLAPLEKADEINNQFGQFIDRYGLTGECRIDGEQLALHLTGISAHGMEPKKGKNAGVFLASFLNNLELDEQAAQYIQFIEQYFFDDSRGKRFGIDISDEMTGELTINAGTFFYTKESGGKIGLNVRYPVSCEIEESKAQLEGEAAQFSMRARNFSNMKPHFVSPDHPLIQTLSNVYEEQTGEKSYLISIGGGTYARSLKTGVAFGPLFPGKPEVAHQKNEYIEIEDLLKATAIYAQAIFELAK